MQENTALVRYLLSIGADVHQRCYGAFFCPDDQKANRTGKHLFSSSRTNAESCRLPCRLDGARMGRLACEDQLHRVSASSAIL